MVERERRLHSSFCQYTSGRIILENFLYHGCNLPISVLITPTSWKMQATIPTFKNQYCRSFSFYFILGLNINNHAGKETIFFTSGLYRKFTFWDLKRGLFKVKTLILNLVRKFWFTAIKKLRISFSFFLVPTATLIINLI
ncbi:unnamed protein product, partial [Vitis vinifera]